MVIEHGTVESAKNHKKKHIYPHKPRVFVMLRFESFWTFQT